MEFNRDVYKFFKASQYKTRKLQLRRCRFKVFHISVESIKAELNQVKSKKVKGKISVEGVDFLIPAMKPLRLNINNFLCFLCFFVAGKKKPENLRKKPAFGQLLSYNE